jgi:hypothetical protein
MQLPWSLVPLVLLAACGGGDGSGGDTDTDTDTDGAVEPGPPDPTSGAYVFEADYDDGCGFVAPYAPPMDETVTMPLFVEAEGGRVGGLACTWDGPRFECVDEMVDNSTYWDSTMYETRRLEGEFTGGTHVEATLTTTYDCGGLGCSGIEYEMGGELPCTVAADLAGDPVALGAAGGSSPQGGTYTFDALDWKGTCGAHEPAFERTVAVDVRDTWATIGDLGCTRDGATLMCTTQAYDQSWYGTVVTQRRLLVGTFVSDTQLEAWIAVEYDCAGMSCLDAEAAMGGRMPCAVAAVTAAELAP